MSVLIKMPMPRNCRECRFMETVHRLDGRERYICIAHLNEITDLKERLETCPLDDPPGIDPEKFVEDYCRPRNLMVVAAEDFHMLAEQKRGKWIYKTQNVKGGKGQTYGKWQCSCCKKKEPRRRDYCPNCGAKME